MPKCEKGCNGSACHMFHMCDRNAYKPEISSEKDPEILTPLVKGKLGIKKDQAAADLPGVVNLADTTGTKGAYF